MVDLIKWNRIKLFHNLIKDIEHEKEWFESNNKKFIYPNIDYLSKIKLDGTNAAVQILPDGNIVAQSRRRILSEKSDNKGFCAWVQRNEKYFRNMLGSQIRTISKYFHLPFVIFGEWCGQGIQKNTAISKIDKKIFAVFAIQFNNRLVVCPQMMYALIPYHNDIYILPWSKERISIDFSNKECIESAVDKINIQVNEIEKRDPWVYNIFRVDGVGEGIVLYPIYKSNSMYRDEYTRLMFKAKTKETNVIKQKKSVQINPEVVESINEFVDLFVTQNRLEQAIENVDYCDMKHISQFLKWINTDIKKESVDELEASGLEWKQVTKQITKKAKEWYISRKVI